MTTLTDHVTALVDAELAMHPKATRADRMLLDDFRRLRARHVPITVNIPGGATTTCIMVTRSNGAYTLVWLPEAQLFSLCVDSIFGPVDIGVHGAALACFSSV
ncbi:hypothetical protein [Sagittula sp. MA-2]|jgi:hypothetical protein|uniref:hypothetical protein n=1 Tax=Sagittula sp. MA-2 TaxID=3048007 RepID=UPI0024C301B1|nr:hypothetical protein [Sagittula sp. MA-2]WHZ34553.1 hypothetical protein QNI11_18195 [Sagittula sp. MA-2]